METCSVPSCEYYGVYKNGVLLYPLPQSQDEKACWVKAFGLTVAQAANPSTRVCGAHFRRKYFVDKVPEVRPPVNGSGPLWLLNPSRPSSIRQITSNISSPASTSVTSPSNAPVFMTFKNKSEESTYVLRIPEVSFPPQFYSRFYSQGSM